jgi:peptide/nickel transport system substrate-binding protein
MPGHVEVNSVEQSDEFWTRMPGRGLGRRDFLRGIAATGAVAGAGGLLAACGGSSGSKSPAAAASSQAPRPGGNLKVGLAGGSSGDTVDPHKGLTYLDTGRFEALYQPLVKLDKQAKVEFVLAESITPHNGSLSEWVVKVRPGVTFNNGKPLTAQDVVFTINRIAKGIGGVPFSGLSFLGPIDVKGVKAVDKMTVLIPMKRPFGSFVDSLAGAWYYLYVVPTGFNPHAPIGTGPFVYQSFTPGERSVFIKNKNYWKPGLPYLDTLTMIDFSDNAAVQDALVTNSIQAAGQLDPPQLAALANTSGVRAVASRTGQFKPFTMRVDQRPFNDPDVRQAMRLMVDRQQLINSALDGYGVIASDVFAPYDVDFNPSLHRQQDIPQAKFLLKKAGQENLTVQLTTSAIATGTVAMATVLAEQAKAAGVTINLKTVDPGVFFGNNYLQWNFSQDYYSYAPYLSQVSQSFLGDVAPFNETHTNNAHYTSLYWQANATADETKIKQILFEMQQFDFTQGAYIIPTFMDTLDAYSDKLAGYTTSKVGESLSNWDFEHFYFV